MESILFLANSSKLSKPSKSRTVHTQESIQSQPLSNPSARTKPLVSSKSNTLEEVEEKSSASKPSLDEDVKDETTKEDFIMSESEEENP